ncbi:MAG TPA: hypothetical protein VFB35_09200 [Gaiellaceae bacterium]|nr:hypothetical protein [Gaiellaceae bacterium]
MKLLALAAAAAALTTAPAHAATPACTAAAAKRAIAATGLRMKLLGPDPVRVDPASADQVLCHDFTRDGRTDLAVTIASGGTAGDIGFAVFRAVPGGWRVALARGGYKIGLFRLGGDVAGSQPVYRTNDPNCCPTGGFDHVRFHWNGTKFVVARAWHTRTFRP